MKLARPHPRPDDGARAQGAGSRGTSQLTLGACRKIQPAAHEGLQFGGDGKKVLDDGLQALRVARLFHQTPGEVELRPIGQAVHAREAVHADANQGADVFRPMRIAGPVKIDGLLRVRPGAEEEAGQPVMEHITKRGERAIAVMQNPFARVFGETKRQWPVRPKQPEVTGIENMGAGRVLLLDRFERGRGEIQGRTLREADRILSGGQGVPDARLQRKTTLQEPDGRVEIKRERLLLQLRNQRICRLPICAGHRMISFRC